MFQLKLNLDPKCPWVLHLEAHNGAVEEDLHLVDEVAPVPAAVHVPSGLLVPLVYSAETDIGSPACSRVWWSACKSLSLGKGLQDNEKTK